MSRIGMPAADKDTNLVQNDLSRNGADFGTGAKATCMSPFLTLTAALHHHIHLHSLLVANLHSCKQVVKTCVNHLLWTSQYIGFHLYISSLDQLVYNLGLCTSLSGIIATILLGG